MTNVNQQKEKVAGEIWLQYFNRVLKEKGVISEEDYRKMKVKIRAGK